MNIWSWVGTRLEELSDDEPRLAQLLDDISTWTCAGQHDRVDAAWPEIEAGLERVGDPWLEVFGKHWRLQSLVLHRLDSRRGLPLAIELLERSARPDARDCPQSVCVAQDVCNAYGQRDGPAFADERLRVSRETLDRIDPSWPCWGCITGEAVDALLDRGDPQAALDMAEESLDAMRRAGVRVEPDELALSRADALLRLNRPEDALAAVDVEAADARRGLSFQLSRRVAKAQVLAALGRHDEALEELPTAHELRVEAEDWVQWSEVVEALHPHRPFTDADRRELLDWTRQLAERDQHRSVFDLHRRIARLDLASGSPARAERALRAAQQARPLLHADMGADQQLEDLASALAATPAGDDVEPDTALARLHASPDDLQLRQHAAEALRLWGELDDAWQLLDEVAHRPEAFLLRCSVAIDLDDDDRLAAVLAAVPEGTDPAPVAWYRSVLAERRGDLSAAIDALDVRGLQLLRRRAQLLRQAERFDEALADLVALGDELPPQIRWERVEVATLVGDHARVRHDAGELGMTFEDDEGPIDASWGWVRLLVDDQHPWAMRTGPATVRILQPRREGPEWVDDVWVVDTAPVETEPDLVFRGVRRIAEGGWHSAIVDGILPDRDLDALRDHVKARGLGIWFHSSDEYRLQRPAGVPVDAAPDDAPGIYFTILYRPGEAPTAVEALQSFDSPLLVFPELLDAAGLPDEAARHRALHTLWEL